MDDKLYLVTCDGLTEGYGCEIYLIGVFTTEEQAISERDKAISQMKTKFKHCEELFDIMPVRKNEAYPLKWEEHTGFVNDYYLGGYVE